MLASLDQSTKPQECSSLIVVLCYHFSFALRHVQSLHYSLSVRFLEIDGATLTANQVQLLGRHPVFVYMSVKININV